MQRKTSPETVIVSLVIAAIILSSLFSVCCRSELNCPRGMEIDFQITETKPNGESWDALGNAPDPMGMLSIQNPDGTSYSERLAQRNDVYSFTAPFFRRKGVIIKDGARIKIEVSEVDGVVNDEIGVESFIYDGTNSFTHESFSGSFRCIK